MNTRFFKYFSIAASALIFGGCIHTYPEIGYEDNPSLIDVKFKLNFGNDWQERRINTNYSKAARDPDIRLIVSIMQNGAPVISKNYRISSDEITNHSVDIPEVFKLKPDHYSLKVWADYIDPTWGDPLAYNCSALYDIKPLYENGEYYDYHDCRIAYKDVDLNVYDDAWDLSAIIPVDMTFPNGQYHLVATDYDAFKDTYSPQIERGERFYVMVEYESEIPGAFNFIDNSPIRPLENISFTYPLEIYTMPIKEMIIANDRLFVPEGGMQTSITVTILNSAKSIICRSEGVKFQMERGKISMVEGNFLTNFISGGISVDPEWNGEIDIILP